MSAKAATKAKSARFELRISPEEKRAIEEKAAERKLTVSEFVIRAALGRAARQRSDVDAIYQLTLCVDQLKAIHRQLLAGEAEPGALSLSTLDGTMQAVCAAIQRVWTNGAES